MSHPTRESFRQFSNLDPQARLEEFQKRFDRMKSEFQNPSPSRQMFESANRPYYAPSPPWAGAPEHDAYPANGHVPVEKTIPIQVQHERSRSEPVAAEQTGFSSSPNNSATGSNNIPHDPRMHPFMPDNSYFQHKFQSPFSGVPSEGGHSSVPTANGDGGEPRVHRIPIQVETRNATGNGPVPMGYTKSPSPTQSGAGHYASSQSGTHPSQSNLHPQKQHPPQQPFISARSTSSSPFDSKSAAAAERNIEIPIQIAKSSSSPAPSKKVDSSFQGAANQSVNESASDPAIADPNQVYAMGYEPLSASGAQNNQNAEKSASEAKKETPFDYVDEILHDLKNFESQVHEFNGTSPADKGYRFLDEMLTLCILRLDCIIIDGDDELRKYRKSAIIEVNRVAAILETKVSKGDKSAATTENTPSQQNDSQGQQCNSDAATQPNGLVAPQKAEDNQTAAGASTAESAAEPKNKKEAKKLEKAKAKKEKEEKEKAKKEAAAGEKKEGRRIILFRGKNKAKAAAQNNEETTVSASGTSEAMDLDTNNNDLKDGTSSTTGSQSASSDQASETASSTTSSTTTLQGKETAV